MAHQVVAEIPVAAALVLRTAAARPVVVGIPAAAAVVLRTAAVEAAIGQVMTAVAHPLATRQEAETLPTVLDGVVLLARIQILVVVAVARPTAVVHPVVLPDLSMTSPLIRLRSNKQIRFVYHHGLAHQTLMNGYRL